MSLPKQADAWMEALLGAPLPDEPRSTCADCAMCRPANPATPAFSPSVKCCTFQPSLPNFLVGAALLDERTSERARAALRRRIAERRGATPLYLERTPREERDQERGKAGYGQDPSLLCDYHEDGRCGVWANREAVCSTFWCLSDRRAVGMRFHEATKRLLGRVEEMLAIWNVRALLPTRVAALVHLDERPRRYALGELPGARTGDSLGLPTQRRIWGPWVGREEAFYRACAARVAPLSWADVRTIGGDALTAAIAELEAARARLDAPLPTVLCAGTAERIALGAGAGLHTERVPDDPLVVPHDVADALPLFDGRPLAEVLAAVPAVGPWLRALVDQEVLGVPGGGDVPRRDRPAGPLGPDDTLAVFRNFRASPIDERLEVSPEGEVTWALVCGTREVRVHESEEIRLLQHIERGARGFRAGDTAVLLSGGWPAARAFLETLVEQDFLQRVPAPPPIGGAPDTKM
ncbi:MAG: hypothetical protein Q8P41_26190 [Pseudomonadota bacterium]|nr:hypothetical protein [Pseudomonadota bacterium]